MTRHEARIKVIQALYQMDLTEISKEEAYQNVCEEENEPFVQQLLYGIVEVQEEIDQLIQPNLTGWSLPRLAILDRAILRLAVYEMGWLEEIPSRVSMDEAIELAKDYGTDESPKFINGVLNAVLRSLSTSGQQES
ncbi:transcription antitermination factor NusB [Rubeoparvulum massiliense]|uniref:transcription antitermination factor NusB n=1 Tax=Rubeoparvulum massiliense TaxID=1631346 RepID=UPI00065DF5C3|nr:transcription antitermination factor NusB [Rubeoparvulum massiliense]